MEEIRAPKPKSQNPQPYNFPTKFKGFLRLMFGGRLYADRLHLFRKYLFHLHRESFDLKHLSPQARDTEVSIRVDKIISTYNRDGVPETAFRLYRERIPPWRKQNRIAQRRAANQIRWEKEKQKKILELPKPDQTDVSKDEKYSLASKKAKKVTGSHPKK